jgi:hypothetical protein
MPVKVRKFKNKKRGTELPFATIPLEEAKNLEEEEVKKVLTDYSPNADAGFLTEDIKQFASDNKYFGNETGVILYEEKEGKQKQGGLKETGDYLLLRKTGKKLAILPAPLLHQITRGGGLSDVLSILETGFEGKSGDGNTLIKNEKGKRFTYFGLPSEEKGISNGDRYCIELYPDEGRTQGNRREYFLKRADPKRILSINIELDHSASEEEKEEKMEFYEKQITSQYGVPVRYFLFQSSFDDQARLFDDPIRIFPKKEDLEKRITGLITMISFGAGIFFLSPVLTGNAIGNINNVNSNWIGSGLIMIGLIGSFLWFKGKNKG